MSNSKEFPVSELCKVVGITRSGYYEWRSRKQSSRARENQLLKSKIVEVFAASDETYGAPRITIELKEQGFKCSETRVARIMSKNGLKAVAGRKFKPQTTDSEHSEPVSSNVIEQDFSTEYFGQKVGCDITYIPTGEGFLYLAVVIDFYSRKVLGHAFSNSLESSLVCQALVKAVGKHDLPEELVHHSDRGSQYASFRYRALLKSLKFTQSMSRAGNCYDNALVESFFHTLKVERVHRRNYATRAIARADVESYINNWYNVSRRHSSLGMLSPTGFLTRAKKAA